MTKKEQIQDILNTTLKGVRFASSQAQILEVEKTATPTAGTITYTGGIYLFGYEMKLAASFKTSNDFLVSLKATIKGDSPASTAVRLIEEFIGGDEGVAAGNKLRDYFPKNFPLEAGFSFKELTLGFEEIGENGILLKSIKIKSGTFPSWKILDTAKFDLDEVNVELENTDIKEGFKNTSLAFEVKASFGKNSDNETVKATLAAKSQFGSKEAFKNNLELKGQVENLNIDIVGLLDLIFEEDELKQFTAICPTEFRALDFENYQVIIKPFGKEFRVVQDTNLGGLELVLKPTELALQAAEHESNTSEEDSDPEDKAIREKAKNQQNILIALTPPSNEPSSFFGDIGRQGPEAGPLAGLDELDLHGTGLIFSTFDDYTTVNLKSLQQFKIDEDASAKFKMRGGLQLFARIKLRGSSPNRNAEDDPAKEEILRSILDVTDQTTRFSLTGFIAKDLKSFELALGLNFGDKNVFIVNNGEEDNIKLKAVEVAFILNQLTLSAGFRMAAVLDAQIQKDLLRFSAGLEFGTIYLPIPTLVLAGSFEMETLKSANSLPSDDRPVWRKAFGVDGLGLKRLGAGIGIGVGALIPPPISLKELNFLADLLLGTVSGKEVTGMVELRLNAEKPAQSLVKIHLENMTLIDIIEAFDNEDKFDFQGPIRDMLNVGFEKLDGEINPAEGIFSFSAVMALGSISADCLVSFTPTGLTIGGSVSEIVIEPDNTTFEIFALRGSSGPNHDRAAILLKLDAENPLFSLTGDIKILGGEIAEASASIDISKEGVAVDVGVNLFGGVFEADVVINAPAITADGGGMYAKVAIKDNVIENIRDGLKAQLELNYKADQEKIKKAQDELAAWRGKDSFLDTINQVASDLLTGLDSISDEGHKVGGMLLNSMGGVFNLDYIKFEGNLDTLGAAVGESGSAILSAEVQLTIADLVINETLEIDFSKGIAQLINALEDIVIAAFDFLKDGFDNLKKGFEELGKLFEEGAKFIAQHAAATIDDVSTFFEDFLKEIQQIIDGIFTGLDHLFNGADMPAALAGQAVTYPAKVRHYSITLDSIQCQQSLISPSIPIRNIFTREVTDHIPAIPDPTGVQVYGYIVMDPKNTMRLGAKNSNGNLIAFSARRGPAALIPVGHKHLVNHTKHFYVNDGNSANIKIIPALRERGLAEFLDDKTLYGGKLIPVGNMHWLLDEDNVKSGYLDLSTKDRLQKIRVHYTIRLYGDYSTNTIQSKITNGTDDEVKHLFQHGANPAKPNLLKALLEQEDATSYLQRMELLLGKIVRGPRNAISIVGGLNIKASTNDISTAIAAGKWDAIEPLILHGAKPMSRQLKEGIQNDIPVANLKMMLSYNMLPDNQSLGAALANEENNMQYATVLLNHNAPVLEQHLSNAIDIGDADLLKLMLKKASNRDKKGINKPITSIISKNILEKAVGRKPLLKLLLSRPIIDQEVFQLALIKAGRTLDERSFQLLISSGARIKTTDFLKIYIDEATQQPGELTQTTLKKRRKILEIALKNGANPTKALQLCIQKAWYDGADKRNGLTLSLDAKANPNLAISYAINKDDEMLLKRVLKPKDATTDLVGKANSALQQIIFNNLTRPNTPNDIALVATALDAGASPNLELVAKGQVFHKKLALIALGDQQNYEVIEEFLRPPTAPPNRQAVDFDPSIFQAIKNIDFKLLDLLIKGGAKLDHPIYVESALERSMGHPLLTIMLQNGAIASTKALAKTLSAGDDITMAVLVNAGAKGTPKMFDELMKANKQEALLSLRPAVKPIVSNFDLAAELNRTDFFQILAQGDDSQLASATPLKHAIINKNIDILKAGLSLGAPPTETLKIAIEAGWRPGILACLVMKAVPNKAIGFAVRTNDIPLLRQLLASFDANPDQALNESLDANKDPLINLALEEGADPNIHMAKVANHGQESRVRLFRSFGAKPDAAMLGTIKHELADLLRFLIAEGAEAGHSWYLDEALQIGNQEIIQILLDNGADPSPFIAEYAAKDDVLIVRQLIVAGANPQDGLLAAVESGFRPMIGQLLKAGADPKGYLHIPAGKGQAEIVDLLILRGADPQEGMEAAIKNNQIAIVERLLAAGADASPPIYMQMAMGQGSPEIVQLLAAAGADPNMQIAGEGILRIAARKIGNEALVATLLANGANPDEINETGDSILHEIVPLGDHYLSMVQLLVQAGANVNARNGERKRVLYFARGQKMIDYLRENGAEGRFRVNP